MPTVLNPYLNFDGNAREAMEFYHSVLGGKLDINSFKDSQMSQEPAEDNKVMHAMLVTDGGIVLMASDTPKGMPFNPGKSISISLSGEDEAELRGYWEKLSEGGKVNMPLEKAPWGDTFGMLTDKFGTDWLVNINAPKA